MLVYTYEYDTAHDPAMPVVEVRIGPVNTIPTLRLNALIDSGSDGTIIPLPELKRIAARKYQKKWMRTLPVNVRKLICISSGYRSVRCNWSDLQ